LPRQTQLRIQPPGDGLSCVASGAPAGELDACRPGCPPSYVGRDLCVPFIAPQADWHIAEVKSHITRQRLRVKYALETGQSSELVDSLLRALEASLRAFEKHRRKVSLPRGSSDAALAPHHVERSKLFVLHRVAAVEELDSPRIARAIEFTQFPYASSSDEKQRGMDEDGSLLRAADLIGQLGDPNYLRKANALYY
jgi:hypothetical protein